MKKYLSPIIASFFVAISVYAFTPATLFIETFNGIKKVAVQDEVMADNYFKKGYKLYTGDNLGGVGYSTISGSDILSNFPTVYNANNALFDSGKIDVGTTSVASITTLNNLTSASALATVGTITSGVWNGTAIDISAKTNLTAGRSLTLSGDSVEADSELYTKAFQFTIASSSVSTTTAFNTFQVPVAFTITQVDGWCKSGTTTVSIDERVETTPKTAGTDIFDDTFKIGDYKATTTFSNASIAAGSWVNLDLDGYIVGTPQDCRVNVRGTVDD